MEEAGDESETVGDDPKPVQCAGIRFDEGALPPSREFISITTGVNRMWGTSGKRVSGKRESAGRNRR